MSVKKQSLKISLGILFALGVFTMPVMANDTNKQPVPTPATVDWKSLDLSPVQMKEINKLKIDYSKKAVKLTAQIKVKKLEIQELLMSPAPNPDNVHQLLQQKLSLESQLQKSQLENFLAIKKLLTPTQLAKLPQVINLK